MQDRVFGVIDMAGVLHSLRSCLTVTLEFIKLIITYIQRKSMRFFWRILRKLVKIEDRMSK